MDAIAGDTTLLLGGELVRDRVDPLLRKAAEEALRKLAGVLSPERRAEMERLHRTVAAGGRRGVRPAVVDGSRRDEFRRIGAGDPAGRLHGTPEGAGEL